MDMLHEVCRAGFQFLLPFIGSLRPLGPFVQLEVEILKTQDKAGKSSSMSLDKPDTPSMMLCHISYRIKQTIS